MTDLVPYQPDGQALAPTAGSLREWADEARAAASIATSLCKTSFVPDAFRDRPEEATAAILTGRELGLSPMASLRAIYVIKGTPAMYANALRAVVQSHGHRIWVEEATDTRAIVCGRRRDGAETERVTWTMDRAKKAGLAGNQQYQKNPQAMLVARATAECARRIAADAIHGVPYAVEELVDEEAIDTTPTATKKPAKRTAKRAPVEPKEPTPAPEPDLDEPETGQQAADFANALPENPAGNSDYTDQNDDEADRITGPQLKKLQVCLREYGIHDRDAGLAYYADVIGHEVSSSKDLTKDEASRIIDRLDAELNPPADNFDEPTLEP